MYYEEIKARLTMPEVVTRYHMQPNRAKFVVCPFHREKTASMKISKDGFYCFGCHEHGNIFAFVMKLFGLEFRQACDKLNFDFGLNIPTSYNTLTKDDKIRMAEERKKREAERANIEELERLRTERIEALEDKRTNLSISMDRIKDTIYDKDGRFISELVGDEDFDKLCGELMKIERAFKKATEDKFYLENMSLEEFREICRPAGVRGGQRTDIYI